MSFGNLDIILGNPALYYRRDLRKTMRRTGAFIILRELGVWVSKGVHTNCLSRHKESQYPSRGESYYCMG